MTLVSAYRWSLALSLCLGLLAVLPGAGVPAVLWAALVIPPLRVLRRDLGAPSASGLLAYVLGIAVVVGIFAAGFAALADRAGDVGALRVRSGRRSCSLRSTRRALANAASKASWGVAPRFSTITSSKPGSTIEIRQT